MHYRIAVVTPFRKLIPHCGLAPQFWHLSRISLSRQLRVCWLYARSPVSPQRGDRQGFACNMNLVLSFWTTYDLRLQFMRIPRPPPSIMKYFLRIL